MIQHFNLTLTGAPQNLLTAATPATGTSVAAQTANRPLRAIHLQAAGANSGAIFVGDDAQVSSTDYGVRIPVPATSVPAAPFSFGDFESGPLKLQDVWVIGTGDDVLHILTVPY